MIETTQTVAIAAPLDATWAYARDVERWAAIMPGYQSCEIHDEDRSTWLLKVGVGGLVRTVKVDVTVYRWAGPEEVDFTFALKGDPVAGRGTYRAAAAGEGTTMTLHVEVSGSGPMAPMWEAMGAPVLPRFAQSFAEELKARIEAEGAGSQDASLRGAPPPPALTARAGWLSRLLHWLRAPS